MVTALLATVIALAPPHQGATASALPVDIDLVATDVANPRSVALGPDGAVWFANYGRNSIGRVTVDGVHSVFVDERIDRPESIAAGPDGAVWFTNVGNDTIGRITLSGAVSSFDHHGIDRPGSITAGPDGNVWFTNSGGNSVGRITSSGVVSIFAGGGIARPEGITAGPDGNVWFANQENSSIGRIAPDGTIANFADENTRQPWDITAGPDGNLWFTNQEDNTIGRISPTGETWASESIFIAGVHGITAGPDGNVWFTNIFAGSIGRITPAGDITIFESPDVHWPWDIVAAPDGNLWFANTLQHSIGRITPTGEVTLSLGNNIREPGGVAVGAAGDLWFTNWGSDSIGRTTPKGLTDNFADEQISRPADITLGPDGNMWFTNHSGGSIGRITPSGELATFSDPGIVGPWGITAGPDGNLWFTNYAGGSVGRLSPDGSVATFAHPEIQLPRAITAGPDGNLWFANWANSSIGRVTPEGVITLFTDPDIVGPWGITAGPDGNLWFTNNSAPSIGRITPAGEVTTFPDSQILAARDITTGIDGSLWFTVWGTGSLGQMTTDGVFTRFTNPYMDGPSGIAAAADGSIWFTNSIGDSLGAIRPAADGVWVTPTTLTPSSSATLWLAGADGGVPVVRPGVEVWLRDDGVDVRQATVTSTSGATAVLAVDASDLVGTFDVVVVDPTLGERGPFGPVTFQDVSLSASPRQLSAASSATVTVWGAALGAGTDVRLVRTGEPARVATVAADDDERRLTATFDLSGAPLGTWTLEVDRPGRSVDDLGDVEVVEPVKPRLGVSVLDDVYRPGFPSRFRVLVSNPGNQDATGIPVAVAGLPEGTVIQSPESVSVSLDGSERATDLTELTYPNGDGTVTLPLVLSGIAAGDAQVIDLVVTLPLETVDEDVTVRGVVYSCTDSWQLDRSGMARGILSNECLGTIGNIVVDKLVDHVTSPLGACAGVASDLVGAALPDLFPGPDEGSPLGEVSSTVGTITTVLNGAECVSSVMPGGQAIAPAISIVNTVYGNIATGADLVDGCLPPDDEHPRPLRPATAVDPNQIVGPTGVGEARTIDGEGPLAYRIDFENLPDADVPALFVTIDDHLDPTVFDLSTVRFGAVEWYWSKVGSGGSPSLDATVPVGDGSGLLLDVSAEVVDPATGHLRWELTTVDPTTGGFPIDPFAGFLPPNDEEGRGEGSVWFTVELLDPFEGLVVENQASIVFDFNDPIVTNTWSNLVDATPPVSSVSGAAANEIYVDLDIDAVDGASGIGRIDLWVWVDDGPATLLGSSRSATPRLVAEPGRTYHFASAAVDGVGNREDPPSEPHASVEVSSSFPDVGDTHPFAFPIMWMAAEGITGGYEDGTFRPAAAISRQAMAAFLYRLAGEPEWVPPAASPFSDVPTSHPFYAPVTWMAERGITGGYEDGTFRPTAAVTRQAMAAFLYRYADGPVPSIGS
ncbi:MAG: S-layer homology domain-containing protein [Acidimicrobiia bacterium]|nr:S-layer homology domain-containing protein [Acidimicrobiia bacterium]